jgi:hypothetical protein
MIFVEVDDHARDFGLGTPELPYPHLPYACGVDFQVKVGGGQFCVLKVDYEPWRIWDQGFLM